LSYASRRSSYLLGSVGGTLQVFAGWWDVYSHLLAGKVDPWWNPAHLMLYTGVAIVIVAVLLSRNKKHPQVPALGPIRFVNSAGLKIAGFGCGVQIVAGVWDEIVHHVLGEPRIAPAYALLTFGMLVVNFGIVVGLAIEYGMIRQGIVVVSAPKKWAVYCSMIFVFASIWLVLAGDLIYAAGILRQTWFDWVSAMLMSVVATLVLVPAKRILSKFGSAILIGVVFNGVAYLLLVYYVRTPGYFPLGMIPVALFELLVVSLKRVMRMNSAIVFSASVVGLLFYATYYPFTSYLFPWSAEPTILLASLFIAGLVGALTGQQIFSGLSSVVLGEISRR
jgi:hypothetical protein